MTQQEKTIFDKRVNGITWKVLGTITLFALTMGWRGNKAYEDILKAIQDSNSNNNIQDVRIHALEVQVEKLEVEVREMKFNKL